MQENEKELGVIDGSSIEDDTVGEPVRYAVTSYGADMPVDGIVSRLNREDIVMPEFQRGFVWSRAQSSRFIESLIVGIPVPEIFLFKDPENNKLIVVDGQQRLLTLQAFHLGLLEDREFSLVGVASDLQDKTYETLEGPDRRHLDDAVVHATIFQQDEPSGDRSSMRIVFERLNTAGTPLTPQEIRDCVYQGPLRRLLSELAGDGHWRNLYGPRNKRRKEEEIILRFLALYYSLESYRRPMKRFLDRFMEKHRKPEETKIREFLERFSGAARAVDEMLGSKALRPDKALNVAVLDAVFVGIAKRLDNGPITDGAGLECAHRHLLETLRTKRLHTEGTTDESRVRARIQHAVDAYRSVL